jgi:steroid delta-isomerase-like uncharacterized protein
MIQYGVNNYSNWKTLFDSLFEARKENGCKTEFLFHTNNNPNELTLLFEWDNLDNARRFIESQDLNERSKKASIEGKPRVFYLDAVPSVLDTQWDAQRTADREARHKTSEQAELSKKHVSIKDHTVAVKKLIRAFNHRDTHPLSYLISDDCEWLDITSGITFKGQKGYQQFNQRWIDGFSDGKLEITNLVSFENQVVVEYIGRGTHDGDLIGSLGTLPATGKSVELHLCDVLEFRNEQVIRGRTYYDSMSLLKQVGAIEIRQAA